ncbi:MAG: Dabb family protein [Pseudomonadota bacterium]
MLRHIVLVSFKPEASEAQLAAWRDAVTNLCETSEEVLSFTLGTNVGSGPNHHDAALVADFDDINAFRRYVSSDGHQAYVEDHAKHVTAKLAAIQHEV